MSLDTLKDRTKWAIDYVIEKERLSNVKLGQMMDIAPGTINSYRTMSTIPNIEFILKFCELFKFSLLWFADGIGYPFKEAWKEHPESKGPNPIPKPQDIAGLFGPEAEKEFIPLREEFPERYSATEVSFKKGREEYESYFYIPQMRGRISAGGGLIPDERVDVRIAFRKEWITRKGDPLNMSILKVSGDSMEPTLLSGDLVLIDHGKNYLEAQGGIYAVAVQNEIMIKRVHIVIPGGKVRIISDNLKYEPMEVDVESVIINGKVIWFAREIER